MKKNKRIETYKRHKSSIGYLAAKYPVVLMYILSTAVIFIPYIGIFAWLVAFLFFFQERDSKLIRVHSAQNGFALMVYSVINLILTIIGNAVMNSAINSRNDAAIINAVSVQANLNTAIRVLQFVFLLINVVMIILAYNYKFFNFPGLGKLAHRLHDRTDGGPIK